MDFSSDNAYGMLPEILAAIQSENRGAQIAYGNDPATLALSHSFGAFFEHPLIAYPVLTGTAANSLALATLVPPYGAVICHAGSHITAQECGAPEFYTGGAKLVGIESKDGKLSVEAIVGAIDALKPGYVHKVQPRLVSLAQPTELGTVYTPEEISEIASAAHEKGLKLHMDGARFANALAYLGCSPAEITWKCGVDVLSFGASKGGAMAAEAVIFFHPEGVLDFDYRRKRGGHLVSKMRFVSVQLDSYIRNDVWLLSARQANRLASRLAQGISVAPGARIVYPVETNIIFAELPLATISRLNEAGARFYVLDKTESDRALVRLVTSFATPEADVEAFISIASC